MLLLGPAHNGQVAALYLADYTWPVQRQRGLDEYMMYFWQTHGSRLKSEM